MIPIEEFFPRVLRYAPGASDLLAEDALREAATEICERTRCWRDVQEIMTFGDEDDIVCVPSDAMIFEIERVWFNDAMLDPVPFCDTDKSDWPTFAHRGRGFGSEGGMPSGFSQASPTSILLLPRGCGRLRVSLFLKPSTQAATLPEILRDHFLSAISDGATARLLTIPNQSFTDTQRAGILASSFEQYVTRNFDFNVRGQQRAPSRTTPSWL